jgi:hypothetical protein
VNFNAVKDTNGTTLPSFNLTSPIDGWLFAGNLVGVKDASINSAPWSNLLVADVLNIYQDNWLSGVDIKTSGTLGLGYNTSLWTTYSDPTQFIPPENNTAYFEIALGNVTDWTLFNTGAPAGSSASIIFNVPTLNTSNPYLSFPMNSD